ncbi:hypothetical protein A6X20_33735 [Bradyrhizobium elkanii]|nr:hypothetical protein A6X20_33735 [Bradyrhizobium elkanii]ODM79411.1 hypothetical protein A6452_27565 [Bradyrhizobium elkanii]
MLSAGSLWWSFVPGAADTGPFNPHLVQDVGIAFIAAGLGLAARALWPAWWPAAVAGAAFLAGHGVLHLVMIAGGHDRHAASDLVAVVLPAALALYSALPNQGEDMRSFIARRMLRAYSRRYGYDTTYLETMLKESPAAFFKFAGAMKAAAYRAVAPVEAFYAAKLTGALAEDCGPCAQLVVDMAIGAGMAEQQVTAVLRRDVAAMTADTALGFHFANAIVQRSTDDDACRDAVRARWGEKGVIDLAMALQIGRIFPMMKLALGYARECRRVTVAGHQIDVIKQAA